MSDRDALYRAILANPAEDTPRLAYADWLEENGRPEEAEFIRIHCSLDNGTPHDPASPELVDREEELRLWLQAHAPMPRVRFRGGLKIEDDSNIWARFVNPQYLEFDGSTRPGSKAIRALASALERAFAILPTRSLTLRFVTVSQLTELLKHPVIAQVRELAIQLAADEELRDDVAQSIAGSPHLGQLRGLALFFAFGEVGAAALSQSTALMRFDWVSFHSGSLTPAVIRILAGAEWLRNVEILRFDSGFSEEAFTTLCRLEPFPRLDTLSLDANRFSRNAWELFAQSRTFPALSVLSLDESDLSDGLFDALTRAEWPHLYGLYLSRCAIGSEGARALTRAPWFGSLRWLNLDFNNLGPSGVALIARSRKLVDLRHCNLSNNTLGPSGLRAIAANPALRSLTTLLLNGSPDQESALTSTDFREFLSRLDLPKLRHMELSGQPIGQNAARVLENKKFGSLTRLNLAGCKLNDAAVAKILAAPTLQDLIELDLSDNHLKTSLSPLADRRRMPRLSRCVLRGNSLDPDVKRKLSRRPGIHT